MTSGRASACRSDADVLPGRGSAAAPRAYPNDPVLRSVSGDQERPPDDVAAGWFRPGPLFEGSVGAKLPAGRIVLSEQVTLNQRVAGSSPAAPTINQVFRERAPAGFQLAQHPVFQQKFAFLPLACTG
jgi:hypothetical protein